MKSYTLSHLAEVDARKLYLPAAYPSMYAYCVGELAMSEDCACKRIRAARAAREFPAVFAAVADGRVSLSAVVLLAPHLTANTADELLAAAAHRSKSEVEQLLAQRFPAPELPTVLEAIGPALSPASFRPWAPGPGAPGVADSVASSAPGRIDVPRPRLAPLAPQRFALQLTIEQGTHDKLRYAQALLGHAVPSGDLVQVLDRALDALIGQLEKTKFAATPQPRPSERRPSTDPRHIPAHVKRTVWERDGGQCSFVSQAGHRCPARTRLEYDHVDPVARGGTATVSGIQLRCRAHNEEGSSRRWRSAHELSRAGTWERHAGKNALN